MSEFAIQVKHLDKMYKLYNKPSDRLKEALGMKVPVREHYALRDVSFDVKRGETVGIIGTNGSGKSTILKIITGVLNPYLGHLCTRWWFRGSKWYISAVYRARSWVQS